MTLPQKFSTTLMRQPFFPMLLPRIGVVLQTCVLIFAIFLEVFIAIIDLSDLRVDVIIHRDVVAIDLSEHPSILIP